jgi:uncharacterized protein (DUF433 family)
LGYFNDMDNSTANNWKYLAPKPGSAYKQLFIKGTRIMARILYGMHMSEELPRTPQEIAEAFSLPLEAVQEAIAYCKTNPPEIQQDWEEEEAHDRGRILNDPNYYFLGIEEKRAELLDEFKADPSPRQ